MTSPYFIFDFDGVVVNTLSIAYEISKQNHPEITIPEYKNMFTGNIYDAKQIKNANTRSNEIKKFFSTYSKQILSLLPVDKIESVLHLFPEKPTIVSSTITPPIHAYLEKYNLRHYFGNILGADVEKSKVIKLQSVQKLHHNREMYFITDTLGDIREAEKVGIEAIAVTWGYHDKAMLKQGNPRAVVNSVEELAKTVTTILSQ